MSDINVPSLPITSVIRELSSIYIPLIKSNLPFDSIPTPFLWGPPGVGKSDGVKEFANHLEDETGKRVIVTDIRLLLFSPIDLRGVPVADETRQFTDWLKPRILDLDVSKDVVNILFLDELSAAPQSVQATAYQLTLNRAIGEHKLPENTIVMAAGNRTTDRSVAFKMPSALANRMMHFDVCVDFKSWTKWAIEHGNIHPMVLGYLSYDMQKLYQEERDMDDVAFPTPRSWMFVSNILNTVGDTTNLGKYRYILASCVGMGVSLEFIAWSSIYRDLPKTEDIFAGKVFDYKGSPDALYALVGSMTTYFTRREKNEEIGGISDAEVENVCRFCMSLPADYALCFYLNIMNNQKTRLKIMKSSSFMTWSKKHDKAFKATTGLPI